MKQMGVDDWLVNIVLELFRIIRVGYGSHITTAVEQITRRKPASFAQFAKDHAEFFRSVGRRGRRGRREDMRIQYIVGLIGHYSTQIPEAATFLKICAEMTVLAGYFDSLV